MKTCLSVLSAAAVVCCAAQRTGSVQPPFTWKRLSGSMSTYGVLVSNSKPLQYNDELNAVSFIHRKSATYVPVPAYTNSSQAVVAMISGNMGATWDSTCLWNNSSYSGLYPQGAIWNPPSNTLISNAYIVGCGPSSNSSGWVGNWFASKDLGSFSASASTITGAQQLLTGAPPSGGKADLVRYDFAATDNGVIWSAGIITDNINSAQTPVRGARIFKGQFNAGVFIWTTDSLEFPVTVNSVSNKPHLNRTPHMAWNESGNIGYLWMLGCRDLMTGSNVGYQPIVYKTFNGGLNWYLVPPINFNNTTYSVVLNHLEDVPGNPGLRIPIFNEIEGLDGIVDANGDLHIAATLNSAATSNPDKLDSVQRFIHSDGEKYLNRYLPGKKPYIYDFTFTSNWTVKLIDSMATEAPGMFPGQPGLTYNPWDTLSSNRNPSNARLQLSRTPDGKSILYTWTDSDTMQTKANIKWNQKPDLKVRLMDAAGGYIINPYKLNVTGRAGYDQSLAGKANLHYVSPKCRSTATSSTPIWAPAELIVPITITNNTTMVQGQPCTHWYTSALLTFTDMPDALSEREGWKERLAVYPNPAHDFVTVLANSKGGIIRLIDILGQTTWIRHLKSGEEQVIIPLNALAPGTYIVELNEGTLRRGKLVVE